MRLFTCQCRWTYLISETHVFGPLFLGMYIADRPDYWRKKMMTAERFADEYADCAYNAMMTNPANQVEHVHPFTD